MRIILATTSPYRIEFMKSIGIPFETRKSEVDEYAGERPSNPEELVKYLSKKKAEAVANNYIDALVIGFDSVGYFNEKILEKPKSYEEAFERLKSLSGKTHEHYTGVTLINTKTNDVLQDVEKVVIKFRELSEDEIKKYLEEDPTYNTHSVGYTPFAYRSLSFIEKVEGELSSLQRAVPLNKTLKMIEEAQK